VTVFDILQLSLPEVHFVTRYEHETVELPALDLAVVAAPHGCLGDGERPEVRPGDARFNVLTTHGLVSNLEIAARYHEPGEQLLDDAMLEGAFDYVALGHIHLPTKARAHMAYSGSTVSCS
jgi:DNA repair exonuclease SbcCD nuclease subunit